MRTYIKKIQSKSENTRKQILVGSLVVCMSLVSVVWINTLGYRFSKEKIAQTEKEIKPFALFGQTVKETYTNVSASVGNISLNTEKDKTVEKETNEKIIDLIPVESQ